MNPEVSEEMDPTLELIDAVIEDLTVGQRRYIARRREDGDADTFVLQDGEEGRLRLTRPDISSPSSVLSLAQAAQRHLSRALGAPLPRCPEHDHALLLTPAEPGYEWVCPAGGFRCPLGGYGEAAWPHFDPDLLASVLSGRLRRRGVTGVRSFEVSAAATGLVARFTVSDLTREIVDALADASAPIPVEVHEHPRQPRRPVGPVRDVVTTRLADRVRLTVPEVTVHPGGDLTYTVVNDTDVAILTGLGFELDERDGSWWYSVDPEMAFAAVGLIIAPGEQRAMTATVPARATPGTYRLRKRIRPAPASPAHAAGPPAELVELPTELEVRFRIVDGRRASAAGIADDLGPAGSVA